MIRVVVVDSDHPEPHLAMVDIHVPSDGTGEAIYELSALDDDARATAVQALRASVDILEKA